MSHSMRDEQSLEESIINAHIEEQSNRTETGGLMIGFIVILLITLSTTYVVGNNWGRWGNFTEKMQAAGEVVKEIPREFGSWEASGEDETLDQASIEQLELSNYVVRRYKNKSTNEHVSLIFMVGPTGRLTAHTPVICFGGRNYRQDGKPTPVSFPYEDTNDGSPKKDVIQKLVFRNQAIQGGTKMFYYGISTGDEWEPLTDKSRREKQNFRFIYKIQLEAFVLDSNSDENDVIARFLREFLPYIRGKLAPCI